MVLGTSRPRYRDVPFRMKRILAANWTYQDRAAPSGSEKAHRHIYVLAINEPASSNLDPRISLSVRSYRAVIIHSRGEIAEMGGGQYLASGRLEVHDVEGLVRGQNDIVALPQHLKTRESLSL